MADHAEGQGMGCRCRRETESPGAARHRFLRSWTLPAVGTCYRLHRLRGVVPGFAESNLRCRGPGDRLRGQHENRETAARRPQPVCRLWRMRVCVSIAGAAGCLRDQHWREPLAQQPDPAEQKLKRGSIEMKHLNSLAVGTLVIVFLAAVGVSGCKKKIANPLPASNAVAGWEKSSETRIF